MEGKYLITTDNWFYGKDGKKYKSVFGKVEILEDSILGVKTNRNSSNWYAKVGSDDSYVIIAGCQIHYAIRCDEVNENKMVEDNCYSDSNTKVFDRMNEIYIP